MDMHLTLDQLRNHLYALIRDSHNLSSTDRHYSWMDATLNITLDQLEGAQTGVPHLWWVNHEKEGSTGTHQVPLTSWDFTHTTKELFAPKGALRELLTTNNLMLRVLTKTTDDLYTCETTTPENLDKLISAIPRPTYLLQTQRFNTHQWETHSASRVAEEDWDTLEEILAEELALHPDPDVQTIRAMNTSPDYQDSFLMQKRKPDYENPRRVVT